MRTLFRALVTVLSLNAAVGHAQGPDPYPTRLVIDSGNANAKPVIFGSAEYLLWWSRDTRLPPLVVLGNPADPIPGALDQPGTRPLFGGDQGHGAMNGTRLTLGGWFAGGNTGWEASGFLFEQRSFGFSASSDQTGNPSFYYPIFRPEVGREGSVSISDSLDRLLGRTAITSQSRLWGAEANLVLHSCYGPRWNVNWLAGFRYLGLQEGISIASDFDDPTLDIQQIIRESFSSRSQFYGGQVGVRLERQWERLSLNLTGKVALGLTHNSVDVRGSDILSGTGAVNPGSYIEGIFAQTSNIGHRTANDFSFVPQIQVKLGYDILPRVRITCSYDLLYWTQVVRAGEQIDRRVDVTQSNVFSPNAPVIAPATFPTGEIRRSSYWGQGAGLGLEFRF